MKLAKPFLFMVSVMLFLAVALTALQSCTPAVAQTRSAALSWTNPTTRTDGTAMAVTEIAQTCAYYSLTKGGPYTGGSQCYTGAATSGSFTLPATPLCGAFYFVVRTTDTQNLTSDVSAEVVKNFPCRPNAPSNFTVS